MKLTIPKPCHENWDAMTPDEKGKFCSVCSKTVRDFTIVSDEEILDVFSDSAENICGNFNESQLNRDLQFSYINSIFTKFTVGFILTTGGFVSVKAQLCEIKNDTVKQRRLTGKVAVPLKQDTIKHHEYVVGGIQRVKVSSNKPLFVIDGKISSEKKFKAFDPELIENVQILKDSSATALYGEKGKNGVILITTKRKRKN